MADKSLPPAFGTWARKAAIDLRHRGPVDHFQEDTSQAIEKALGMLTSTEMLYPDEEDGYPGYCYYERHDPTGFDDYMELLMVGLYHAYYHDLAAALIDGELDGKGVRRFNISADTIDDSNPDEKRELIVQVSGVVIG